MPKAPSTWHCLILQIKAKDPNVIIIDTNTLLKNQGNLAAAVAQSNTTGSSNVQTIHPRSTTTSSNTVSNMSIQNAIQAITGGVPAQGLQSAYITALQQVRIALGNIFQSCRLGLYLVIFFLCGTELQYLSVCKNSEHYGLRHPHG